MALEWHDDNSRTFATWDEAAQGFVVREYTPEEVAAAEQRAAARTSIENALSAALDELQLIIDDTNANINTNPAARIKMIARALKRAIRIELRRFEATD
jgi:hypothetical protein